jgi:RHS repeat-associated protein
VRCTFSPLPDEPLLSLLGSSGLRPLASKTRVGKNLFGSTKAELKRAFQPPEAQQGKPAAKKKIASGARHYRARYFGPNIGRFLSRDPRNAELNQRTNLYWYARNNTVRAVDPMGLIQCTNGDYKKDSVSDQIVQAGAQPGDKWSVPPAISETAYEMNPAVGLSLNNAGKIVFSGQQFLAAPGISTMEARCLIS